MMISRVSLSRESTGKLAHACFAAKMSRSHRPQIRLYQRHQVVERGPLRMNQFRYRHEIDNQFIAR
jgi:hypothetical protein